jgi:hypothetical protein
MTDLEFTQADIVVAAGIIETAATQHGFLMLPEAAAEAFAKTVLDGVAAARVQAATEKASGPAGR